MAKGTRPDFTLLRTPENGFVTPAQRWFIDQLLDLEPGSEDVDAGGYSHKPGYHDTVAHNDARSGRARDYSARDPEDRRGPLNRTRARDWTFRDAQAGDFRDLAKYGDRLLAAYRRNDPRLGGWREYLGRVSVAVSVSGVATRRVGIDFRHRYLRIPDSSHDWHGHFSEDTEQVESFWNKWAMLTILANWSTEQWRQSLEEDDMTPAQAKQLADLHSALFAAQPAVLDGKNLHIGLTDLVYAFVLGKTENTWLARKLAEQRLRDEAILTAIEGLDTEAILTRIDQRASETSTRDQILLSLLEQHAAGTIDATQTIQHISELLTPPQE
jgi:hypothetical protein